MIPWVATRQWVITVPFRRRWLLARRTDLVDGVLRVALRRITRWYRKATGRPRGKSGAVTSIQRFGSALNLNVYFHVVHLDGVYDCGADAALRFFQATPTNEDIEALAVDIATACERWLSARGFSGEAHDDDPDVGEDDAQGFLQLASLMGMAATGERAGKKARRTQRLGGREIALGPRCAAFEGYNIHANVSFGASDRGGLERLCRYVLRPPLALGRLERLPNGRVLLRFKGAWSDGTTGIELSTQEFVEKLAAIVPPPRANQVLYAGVLAGNAALRAEVVPKVPTSTEAEREARAALKRVKAESRRETTARAEERRCWAELLKRVFEVDGWACPHCNKPMKLRSIVIREPATTQVVSGLLRATGPPAAA